MVANIKLDVYEIVLRTNTLAYSVPKTQKNKFCNCGSRRPKPAPARTALENHPGVNFITILHA